MFDLTRFFKKGINWSKQLSKYQHTLNTTPRRCLAWKTPMQVYFRRCANNTETVQKIRDSAIAATRKPNSYTEMRQKRLCTFDVIVEEHYQNNELILGKSQ